MKIISFVILHYKDLETTDLCVKSILRMEQQDRIRIVIVDNDIQESTEKRAVLKEKYRDFANIEVLQIKENGGFSHANNQGYAYAREQQGASFIVVLNNDIEFTQEDFAARLDQAYAENPCHVMGPDVVRRGTGEHQNPMDTRLRTKEEAEYTIRMNQMALRWFPVLFLPVLLQEKRAQKKKLEQKRRMRGYYEKQQGDVVLFGACLIFTEEFIGQNEKAFDPETEFYYEEYILAHRCREKGYHTVYEPALKVTHESGKATSETFESAKRRLWFRMEKTLEACKIYKELL